MGNCFGSRVISHHTQSSIMPPTPETSKKYDRNKQLYGGLASKIHNSSNNNKQPNDLSANKVVQAETGSNISRSNYNNKDIGHNYKEELRSSDTGDKILTPNLKMFTLSELKSATRNFRPDTVLGEGGFGRVFKGWVDEKTYSPSRVGVGMAVAVKKSNPDSSQGLKEWQAEVRFLGKFSHQNLVRLLGYCWEEDQFLLVYEYMQKGSLENHLFRKGAEPLSWEIRLNIVIGAAQGLAFLHTSEKSVIYRDFKASNILLDSEYNAKLSDFGLAKFGPINGDSHVTTQILGTYGYAAPEYVATGHLYVKSDVYGFGVVLLEMLVGWRAYDTHRPSHQHKLVDWAKPSLTEKRKLRKIMDQRLEGRYPIKGAMQIAELIVQCLESDPKDRPSMERVLDTLIAVKAIKEKPNESIAAEKSRGNKSPLPKERSTHPNYMGHHRSPLHVRHCGPSNGGRVHPPLAR